MMLIARQIREGEMLPRFYGIAYHDFTHSTIVCYPFPFNIIVQYWRKWWMALRYYHKENPLEEAALRITNKKIHAIKEQSYMLGLGDGEQTKRHEVQKVKQEVYNQGRLDMYNEFRTEVGLDKVSEMRKE